MLLLGDCLEELQKFEANSMDSLVTDPPAGISFMGKHWDGDKGGRIQWIIWMSNVMRECLRVLKPGAHALVWALPRTSHWTASACEDAGFEVRDIITHLFGQGFPKSHNLEKATDGIAKGQGTALKPASEHWILIRKPISEKTVAANVIKWGCGGLNIDGCRIEIDKKSKDLRMNAKNHKGHGHSFMQNDDRALTDLPDLGLHNSKGRFPANLVFSHTEYCTDEMCDITCAARMLDEQSLAAGIHLSGQQKSFVNTNVPNNLIKNGGVGNNNIRYVDNHIGASRFFYCAKSSPGERNAGMADENTQQAMSKARPNSPDMTGKFPDHDGRIKTGNFHPTVKPQKLMRYLIKLVTPPKGIVLDPFMGSGSTGLAANGEGFKFIGIEKEEDYFEIAKKRIEYANRNN